MRQAWRLRLIPFTTLGCRLFGGTTRNSVASRSTMEVSMLHLAYDTAAAAVHHDLGLGDRNNEITENLKNNKTGLNCCFATL